jgi:hypothetical protein
MVPYRLLSLFVNMGKQTKPICFFSKGRSGMSGEAYIEGRSRRCNGQFDQFHFGALLGFWERRDKRQTTINATLAP